jgi:hypothetical protein
MLVQGGLAAVWSACGNQKPQTGVSTSRAWPEWFFVDFSFPSHEPPL